MKVDDFPKDKSGLSIPAAIWIGVTGHREIEPAQAIRERVKEVLTRLDNMLDSDNPSMPKAFVILSPLAEGSDRLVAEEVLDWASHFDNYQVSLRAVLPLPENEYMKDFHLQESKDQFRRLLLQAKSIKRFEKVNSRQEAYLNAGRYAVNNCDVLIAIWDGKPSRGMGGTADIVKYAQSKKRLIFWIDSVTGTMRSIEPNRNMKEFGEYLNSSLSKLKLYDQEKLNEKELKRDLEYRSSKLLMNAGTLQIPEEAIRSTIDRLLPSFIKATSLARYYQRKHVWAGLAVYALSAMAVATVPLQVFFLPEVPQFIWFEVLWISIILCVLILSSRQQWQRKWIDYRLLAELIRSSLFCSLVQGQRGEDENMNSEQTIYSASYGRSLLLQDWRLWAFAWLQIPEIRGQMSIPFISLKAFLLDSWIDDQKLYYTRKSHEYRARHEYLDKVGLTLIIITLFSAAFHATGAGELWLHELHILPKLLITTAIVLPAIGASLAGIRVHREYLLNAERYDRIAADLSAIEEDIMNAKDMSMLIPLIDAANDLMLSEHLDWSLVAKFARPHI